MKFGTAFVGMFDALGVSGWLVQACRLDAVFTGHWPLVDSGGKWEFWLLKLSGIKNVIVRVVGLFIVWSSISYLRKSNCLQIYIICAPFLPRRAIRDNTFLSPFLGAVLLILSLDLGVGVELLDGALGGFWSSFASAVAGSDLVAGLLESLQLRVIVNKIRIILHTIIGILLVKWRQIKIIIGCRDLSSGSTLSELTLLLGRLQGWMVDGLALQSRFFLVPLDGAQNGFNLNIIIF